MTQWNGNLTNEDGLIVEFGTNRSDVVTDGTTQGQAEHMLTMYIDSQALVAVGDSAREDVARLPEHALITSAWFVAESAWTGTGTLDIGTADSAGSAIDANGLFAAIDVDVALAAAGDAVVGAGVLADGTDIIAEDSWVYATASGTVSAGVGTLYIRYILTNAQ
jgi:hypothetical protein